MDFEATFLFKSRTRPYGRNWEDIISNYQDRPNRLLEQTQRRNVRQRIAGAATWWRRENFSCGRVSPSRDLRTQLLYPGVRFRAIEPRQSTSGDPFLLYGITIYAQSNDTPRRWEACDEPLNHPPYIPPYPFSLDLPNDRYFIVSPMFFGWGINRGPRLGP